LVRPFTLSRLADLVHLAQTLHGITADHVEDAMMVTTDRAVELIKQAEEMKLIAPDGFLYHSTSLGNEFFESFRNCDNGRLDNVLCQYAPYLQVKKTLSEMSADVAELKTQTGLTEVAIEIVLRLLHYTRSDFCCVNERYFLRTKELPDCTSFLSTVRKIYSELSSYAQWGCSKNYIRVDRIASRVCSELRLSFDDFAGLLDTVTNTSSLVELHSEVASYQFIPFSQRGLDPKSYRKTYLRLRMKA
jgi:hypothetical protein